MHQKSHQNAMLQQFKAKPCNKCNQKYAPYYFNCHQYHNSTDKRRNPLLQDGSFAYSQQYILNGNRQNMCLNIIEHYYHPSIFRVNKCTNTNCSSIYALCPFYHSDSQRVKPPYMVDEQLYNNLLKQINKDLTIDVQSLQNIMKKLDDKVSARMQIQSKLVKQLQAEQPATYPGNGKQQIKQVYEKTQNDKYVQPAELSYYSYGEELGIIQDRHHQFKMFKNFVITDLIALIMKYIVGFLNSEGGVLYLGVNDSSLVHGIQINQKEYDLLLVGIDKEGKKTAPPLMPQKYRVRRVPVYNYQNKQLYVIEIRVKQNKQSSLTVYNRQCFMRMNASISSLSVLDLIQYQKINLSTNLDIEELTISQLQAMTLQQLGIHKKKLINTLKNIDLVIEEKIKKL